MENYLKKFLKHVFGCPRSILISIKHSHMHDDYINTDGYFAFAYRRQRERERERERDLQGKETYTDMKMDGVVRFHLFLLLATVLVMNMEEEIVVVVQGRPFCAFGSKCLEISKYRDLGKELSAFKGIKDSGPSPGEGHANVTGVIPH